MPTPLDQVADWKAGGRASASGFNAVLDAVRENQYGRQPNGRVPSIMFLDYARVVTEKTNYLECKRVVFPTDGSAAQLGEAIDVLKPFKLRGAVATKTVSGEAQEIYDPYAVNDALVIGKLNGPTGVNNDAGAPIFWIDLNVDARRWSEDCS